MSPKAGVEGEDLIHMVPRARKDVLVEPFEDGLVLFDLRKYLPYILNPIASVAWMNMDGKSSLEAIAGVLCLIYDVDFERALTDLRCLIRDLMERNIIEAAE